jgi:peptidoglycan/xylan/chitin deacetylase (PgdA/CDA1 family)
VALTFDDGPGPTTETITTILRAEGVTATFFNLGQNIAARPQDVATASASGYALGNHTWDHQDMIRLSATQQAAEMDQATAEQQSVVGASPCLFRPPYGDYDSDTLNLAYQRHMAVWLWSVDTLDWQQGTSTSAASVQSIVSRAEQGINQSHPVILMHNQGPGTPAATPLALPTVINFYRQHGYAFVNLLGGSSSGQVSDLRPTEATNRDGRPEMFATSAAGSLVHDWWTATGWSGFQLLANGSFAGRVAAVRNSDGRLEVFAREANGMMVHLWQLAPGGWSGIAPVGGFPVASDPSALIWPDGHGEVFAANAVGQVVGAYRLPNGSWSGWLNKGGASVGPPAIGVNQNRDPELFTVSPSGVLTHAWWTGSAWVGWLPLVTGIFGGTPSVVANPNGTLEVFVRSSGTLEHLWQNQPNGTAGWSAAWPIGGSVALAADPAVVLWPDGHAETFSVATSGAVMHAYRSLNGSWSPWFSLGATATGSVTAWSWPVTSGPGDVDVVARLGGGCLAHSYNVGSGWSPWFSLGGSFGGP